MVELTNKEFFQDLDQTIAAQLFEQTTYPWEILPLIKDFVLEVGPTLSVDEYDQVEEDVWIREKCNDRQDGNDQWTSDHWSRYRSAPRSIYQRKCIDRGRMCCRKFYRDQE